MPVFIALQRRSAARERAADFRAGVLCAVVSRIAGNREAKPGDFFASLRDPKPKPETLREKLLSAFGG